MSPEYVLDRMEQYEITTILKNLHLKNKDGWEQARTIAYVTAQVNATKPIDPKDIMKFPWENEKAEETVEDTQDDIKALMAEAKRFENKMNGRNNI